MKQLLKDMGWEVEEFRAFQKIKNKEIDIEFCMGDFCVGVYDENLNLLEPKYRAKDIFEAIERAGELITQLSK